MNGYIGIYKGKQYEVYSDTSYHAQLEIAKQNNIKDSGAISVFLAEKEGQAVIHNPADIEGRSATSVKVLDKSTKRGIMTSEGKKGEANEPKTTSNTSMDTPDNGGDGSTSSGLPQAVQASGVQEDEEGEQSAASMPGQGSSSTGERGELNQVRRVREGSMEPSNTSSDTGNRDRLASATDPLTPGSIDTSLPRDIILDSNSDIGADSGATARFEANLDAIRTLKLLDGERRQATPQEQAILAKYSGFGDSAFNEAFNRYSRDSSWEKRGERLKEILTEDEYQAIERSRLNAFYTTPKVINAMWGALNRLGVDNLASPRILEPSAGSGRFLGFQPQELAARSKRSAVELDQLTGRMLKHTYPDAEVYVMGYEKAPIAKESVDVAISNVPFGDYAVNDPSFTKGRRRLTRQIHNYFFAKSLEQLRPGGVLSFITSHGTMDSPSSQPVREALAEQADLIAAIRLPKTAFPDTEVVTDIIFMRKRMPGEEAGDKAWVNSEKLTLEAGQESYRYPVAVNVNKYFLNNPDMVLGKHSTGGSMYRRDEYTVEPDDRDLADGLASAVKRIPENIITDVPRSQAPRSMNLPSSINVHEGTRILGEDGNTIYVKRVGELQKADMTGEEQSRVRGMLELRDAARVALNTQLRDGSDEEIETAQLNLNALYDKFVIRNGPLNADKNADLMREDPDGPFLRALEKWDTETAKTMKRVTSIAEEDTDKIKMPLFSQRTVRGLGLDRTISSDSDAAAIALNETGRLDFTRMGELLGRDADSVRKELAEQRQVFKNPLGDWEPADQYLTGDVREKLRTAEAAASANPAYNVNVEALKTIQPVDLTPSQISVRLGSPWVPSDDVNAFVSELLDAYRYRGRSNYFKYVPETGDWVIQDRVEGNHAKMTSEWGTSRMPAKEIIHRLLNGKLVEVTDKDADDKVIRNAKETVAAQEKSAAIQAAFKEWIWNEPDRAKRLAAYYNDTFNTFRTRSFDGAHQVLPGMEEGWAKKIHKHQKDAIWRVVQDRTALLGHEVGFGKTAVMVAGGMELRRLGLARKNVYVVPKATHGQFEKQYRELYPYANILFPSDEDFTPNRRTEFLSRAVTGDWDAVILSDSQFGRIPIKPETEAAFLKREVDSFRAALEAEEEAEGGKRSASHKDIQKSLIRLEERLAETQAKIGAKTENTIYFEDMGIDQMFVDEADMYKNLRFATNMGRLKGLPNSDSQRAWDMYQKTRYLQQQGKGQGVVFATGTPVANTIAEMYTMMRYLQNPMLEAKGLQHFDSWAKTFGETTETLEQTPTGAYKLTQRFAKFQNAPELSNIWQQTTDIRVASEVPEMVKLRPYITDEEGRPRRTVISVAPDQELLDYMKKLAERADELKDKDPREDNMLKIANDARMASLDMRMVDPSAKQNPEGKVATASSKVAEIYKETTKDKGTQLIFLDLGTPKAKEKVTDKELDADIGAEGLEETGEEAKVLRNVYRVLKEKLVAAGVDEKEIAFIHDAKNKEQRDILQARVNSGDIRVIVGSTGKMGVGVNVQKRAAALHHLDAPWRPRDIEQREGRIVRQGNEVYGPKFDSEGNVIDAGPGVKVYTYVTEQSFDAYMWQAIEAKSKAIKSIMRRDNPPRDIEDIDSLTMSAGEAKAVASGNPDVLKAVTLKNNVTRLQMIRASHIDAKVRAREQLQTIPVQIEHTQEGVRKMEQDVKLIKPDAPFTIKIKGSTYLERTPAGETLKATLVGLPITQDPNKAPEIGEYKGFKIHGVNQGPGAGYTLIMHNPASKLNYATTEIPYSEVTAVGVLQRVEKKIAGIPAALEAEKLQLSRQQNNLKTYQVQAETQFEYQDRLSKMEAELTRLEKKLQGEKVDETPIEYEPLEEELVNGEKETYKFTPKEPEPLPEPPFAAAPKPKEVTPPITEGVAPEVTEAKEKQDAIDYIIESTKRRTDRRMKAETRMDAQAYAEELATKYNITYGDISARREQLKTEEVTPPITEGVTPEASKAVKPTAKEGTPQEKPAAIHEATPAAPKPKVVGKVPAKDKPHAAHEVTPVVVKPKAKVVTPKPDKVTPKPDKVTPKPDKVTPKPTSEEKPQPSKTDLVEIQEKRSRLSRVLDAMTKHSLVLDKCSKEIRRWVRNQGHADVKGIDTPADKVTPVVVKPKAKVVTPAAPKPKVVKKVPVVPKAKLTKDKPHAAHEVTPAITKSVKPAAKAVTPKAPKPKREEKSQPTLKDLLAIQARRGNLSQGLDAGRQHSLVLKVGDKEIHRWEKNQGLADVQGIDTPGSKGVVIKSVATKENPPRKRSQKVPVATGRRTTSKGDGIAYDRRGRGHLS